MYFEDLNIGDVVVIEERLVEEEEMLAFAYRYNGAPCHTNKELAAKSRVGRITAPGAFTFSLMWGGYAPTVFGGEHEIAGTYLNITYKGPVFAGDRLHGTVTLYDKVDRNKYNGEIFVRMKVYNQNDEVVLISESNDIIMRRPIEE